MKGKLILWAQALDNTSSDHIQVRGKALNSEDIILRQEAVSLVSSVIKGGARIFDVKGVLLTADDKHFVVEVPSAQRDSAGRTAPIVCYGDYDATFGDALVTSTLVALDEFVKCIGRTLHPEHLDLARKSFETLKKKSSMTKLVRVGLIGAVGFVIYWLLRKGW